MISTSQCTTRSRCATSSRTRRVFRTGDPRASRCVRFDRQGNAGDTPAKASCCSALPRRALRRHTRRAAQHVFGPLGMTESRLDDPELDFHGNRPLITTARDYTRFLAHVLAIDDERWRPQWRIHRLTLRPSGAAVPLDRHGGMSLERVGCECAARGFARRNGLPWIVEGASPIAEWSRGTAGAESPVLRASASLLKEGSARARSASMLDGGHW